MVSHAQNRTIQLFSLVSKWYACLSVALFMCFPFTYDVYVWNRNTYTRARAPMSAHTARGRLTIPYEVFVNVCLTCADADCIPVNHHGWQKTIQNQLKYEPYHLQLPLLFQGNKCNLHNLSQIVWHLKGRRCQSRKNRECDCVGVFEARPSGLFWPTFQRSNAWLSYRNYFSRTNLFIEISMSNWLLNKREPASKTG